MKLIRDWHLLEYPWWVYVIVLVVGALILWLIDWWGDR